MSSKFDPNLVGPNFGNNVDSYGSDWQPGRVRLNEYGAEVDYFDWEVGAHFTQPVDRNGNIVGEQRPIDRWNKIVN
jgi:hypothetical protein